MRPASLTTGLPFKAAIWSSIVFLTVCAVSGLLLVRTVESALLQELTTQAQSEAVLLSEIYTETGEAGLLEALRITAKTTQESDRFTNFFGSDGVSLTGPMSVLPDFVGTRRVNINQFAAREMTGGYILLVRRIDQKTLVVGRSASPVRTARARLVIGLSAFAGIVTLAVLSLGLWASRMSQHRLDDMDAALHKVGEGDMTARLPILGRKDQFDQVSMRVNQNLDHLERAVGSMKAAASAIAHDLKTPLSHVQIALHAAADAAASGDDPLPHIDGALQETEDLNGIFEAVLRISRIRATRDYSTFEPVPLDDLAAKTIEFLTPLAERYYQTLTLETTHPDPIFADKAMLQQAVINIVQNAVVYAGENAQIKVIVSDRQIAVRDTGPGAHDQDLERLLEPFARGDASRMSDGAGLGLALVKAVAERHGAQLVLRNLHPGFLVTLSFEDPALPS